MDEIRSENFLFPQNTEPKNFSLEESTIWSFPNRGSWATHNGKYRGNWSPYIPRNLILRFSNANDWILDQFAGSGTTLVEAKLLDRNAIGVDINPDALKIAKNNLEFKVNSVSRQFLHKGDATNLYFLKDESIDFICTHPPYAGIIKYSKDIDGDISLLNDIDFINKVKLVAKECYRVLKFGRFCAIMMGDARRGGRVVPLGFETLNCFLDAGFVTKEIIIKEQHNCRSTPYWTSKPRSFLLLAHEYIFVLEKPLIH